MSDTLTIPDALPVLSKGNHIPGTGRACIMDAISILSGRDHDQDRPKNVLPVLHPLFIHVNDRADEIERQQLWSLGIRAMGTAVPGDSDAAVTNHKVTVALMIMQAMRNLGNDSPAEHAEGVQHLQAALGWLGRPNYASRLVSYTIPSVPINAAHCHGCHFARYAARSLAHSDIGTEVLANHLRGIVSHAGRMTFLGQVMDDVEGVLDRTGGQPTEGAWQRVRAMITNPEVTITPSLTAASIAAAYGLPQFLLGTAPIKQSTSDWAVSAGPNTALVSTS